MAPWSDSGWVAGESPNNSPCCAAAITCVIADGVVSGMCNVCCNYVVRLNPKTHAVEVPAPLLDPEKA